jgi:hypothetical protein
MAPEQPLITDGQFNALLAALVAFGGAVIATLRWSVGRITKAVDDSTSARLKQAEAFVELKTKIDEVHDQVVERVPRARVATPALGSTGRPRPLTDDPQRGSAVLPLLVILGGAAVTVGAYGCAGARRTATAVKDAVVDCAKLTAEAHVEEYAARVEAAILAGTAPNGEVSWGPAKREIGSILADAGWEIAGCSAATAVARILYPTADRPRGIVPTPEPSAAKVRDGWAEARESMLGGRRFEVRVGSL